MISFIGEFEATVDPKSRFSFPAGFKKQLSGDEAHMFVINRGLEKCLTLFPLQSWKPIFKEISLLNEYDPQVRDFRRKFFNGATPVELDSAGRLLLPKNLMEYAGIEKEIVLASAVTKIEIWDKSTYQKLFESFSPEEFSRQASEVMAPKPTIALTK